jgi:hypothetical protein
MVSSNKAVKDKPKGRIYVIANRGHLRSLKAGERSWWCIERGAEVGEIGAVYVIRTGLSILFRYEGPAQQSEQFCNTHNMQTGNILILAVRDIPFTFMELKDHRVLSALPALRRSFQSRSFRLDEPFLSAVCALFSYPPKRKRAR